MSGVNTTEVLVVGAGPAGIAAAMITAERGRKVTVLDDNRSAGGQIWRAGSGTASTQQCDAKRQRTLDRLQRSGAQLLTGRTVFNATPEMLVETLRPSAGGDAVERFRCEQLILATGARERMLPFPGWTLPGVFGAGGLQALVRGGYSVAGKRIVVAGTGPLLLAVAAHLVEDGAEIGMVAEQAPLSQLAPFAASLWRQPAKLWQGARYRMGLRSCAYRTGTWVTEALPAADGQMLSAVRLTDGRRSWTEPCHLLACGYHLVPNTEIADLLGCAMRGGFVRVDEQQRTSLPNIFCVGEPTGIAGLDAALAQGEVAGLACAGVSSAAQRRRVLRESAFAAALERAFALRAELRSLPRPDTIVCRCEDVRFAQAQGHAGWSDTKLQTRCGMGPCQGRICGPAVEFLLGWPPASVRQPLYPVPLHALSSAVEPAP
jgi:NADPH-dependent 2,4-dienoyl-CoA reductase/sulfur reductase-like enzyme